MRGAERVVQRQSALRGFTDARHRLSRRQEKVGQLVISGRQSGVCERVCRIAFNRLIKIADPFSDRILVIVFRSVIAAFEVKLKCFAALRPPAAQQLPLLAGQMRLQLG